MIVVSDVDMIVNAMKTAGFTSYSVEPLVIFFQKPESSIRVDFLRTDVTTLNKLMQSAVLANVMNCHVKIPSLIDLLAMKFFSYSQSPLRRVKDLNDIVWLSIENKLDPETVLRPIALKFANDETYRQVCAILSSNQI